MSRQIVVIAHDIRSTHNVGALLRTADGLGVQRLYFTGFTPYPRLPDDVRLPYMADKQTREIHKTALGAETSLPSEHRASIDALLTELRHAGYQIVGLEQSPTAIRLPDYQAPAKVALLLGREVEGIDTKLLQQCDQVLEIPMFGQKESFNVVQAAAMALYQLTFSDLK